MRELPYWYEDEHSIYVHAGIIKRRETWEHPRDTEPESALLWTCARELFTEYGGKRVIVGHTATDNLPQELSLYTVDDPSDMFESESVLALDTSTADRKCGPGFCG